MVLKEDWDNDSQTRDELPQALNDAAAAINTLPDTYVSLGDDQTITGYKTFANDVSIDAASLDLLNSAALSAEGDDGESVYLDAFILKLGAPHASELDPERDSNIIQFTGSYWTTGPSALSAIGDLKLVPNSGSPYFEFDQPVASVGLSGIVGAFEDYADFTDASTKGYGFVDVYGQLGLQPIEATAIDPVRAANLALYSQYWTGSASARVGGQIYLQPNSGTPYFEFDKSLVVNDPANDFVITLSGTGTVEVKNPTSGEYASLDGGFFYLESPTASGGAPNQTAIVDFVSKFWDGDSSETVDGNIKFQPNSGSPYFEFDQEVRAPYLQVNDGAYFSSDFSSSTVSYVDVSLGNSPTVTIGALNADAGHTQRFPSLRLKPTFWNGSTSVTAQIDMFGVHDATDTWVSVTTPVAAASTGATTSARFAGGTATGAPTTGVHKMADFIVTEDGHIWVCTAGGTPGTWRDLG